jgi:hypothetical protein
MSNTTDQLKMMADQVQQHTDGQQQAFPCNVQPETVFSSGMSLRDWFAAQALPTVYRAWDESCLRNVGKEEADLIIDVCECLDSIAEECYHIAEEMMKARKVVKQ